MSLIDSLTPKCPPAQPFVRTRRVPSQPGSVPGKVYLGSDLGFVDYQGKKPRAGDLVHVAGSPGRYVATTGQAVPSITQPTFFPGACECKCPVGGGYAFHLSAVRRNSVVLIVETATSALKQILGKGDLWWGRGLAVDSKTPYALYILDDRRVHQSFQSVANPTIVRDYFVVTKYTLSAGQYVFASRAYLVDPSPNTTTTTAQMQSETNEQDPPNFIRNGLSVFSGQCWLTMWKSPGRILRTSGTTFTTLNLKNADGSNYSFGLRGNVVQIPDKPAKRDRFYVLGANATDTTYELVEFTDDGTITRKLTLDIDPQPAQLATVCNRLMILHTNQKTFVPNTELSV